MYCNHCGNQIPDGSQVCNFCGQNQGMGYGNPYQAGGYPISPPRRRIDNIFTALIYQRTPGVIMEFTLWCIVCFVVILSLVVTVLAFNAAWLMMMIFAIGLGVILAFRLNPIAILYGICSFHCFVWIAHYICFTPPSIPFSGVSHSALNIILFVLGLLVSIALVTCGFIYFFSRARLKKVLLILSFVDAGVTLLLHVMMYAASYFGVMASSLNEAARNDMDNNGYWFGTMCFWVLMAVVDILMFFFFKDFIENKKEKIVLFSSGKGFSGGAPGIQYIGGMYAGKIIYLQGNTVTIGSSPEMQIYIPDTQVSAQHCAVRFNSSNGYYEIYDNSINGVHLKTGGRLQRGIYNYVQRGSTIYIGSMLHQFQLL